MPATAEGGVDEVTVGRKMEGIHRFFEQDGLMCPWGRHRRLSQKEKSLKTSGMSPFICSASWAA
jgi:hypothetical protein